jgi:nucleoside-diphosphate-sugar epimerase
VDDPSRRLLIFGLGYTGTAIGLAAAAAGYTVTATSRQPDRAAPPGIAVIPFAAAEAATIAATHIVATAAPDADGDPALHRYGAAIAEAPGLRWIGYLSSTGVYGDRGGAWVDEASAPAPTSRRATARRAAEEAWEAVGAARGTPVDIIRLAGIYGPGRSLLDDVRSGRARRIDKPGHAFGRIHREDIAAGTLAAMGQAERLAGTRVLNFNDDLPAEPAIVVEEAARLLGLPPPPLVPFAEAAAGMSAMGRSFWAESRRVSGAGTQASLGYVWRFPTFREGLRAILAQEASGQP